MSNNFDSQRLIDTIKEEITFSPGYVSQKTLAAMLGMSRETFCRKLNDISKLSVEELASIAAELGRRLHIYFE